MRRLRTDPRGSLAAVGLGPGAHNVVLFAGHELPEPSSELSAAGVILIESATRYPTAATASKASGAPPVDHLMLTPVTATTAMRSAVHR